MRAKQAVRSTEVGGTGKRDQSKYILNLENDPILAVTAVRRLGVAPPEII
jgi:hypothetical protein